MYMNTNVYSIDREFYDISDAIGEMLELSFQEFILSSFLFLFFGFIQFPCYPTKMKLSTYLFKHFVNVILNKIKDNTVLFELDN